MLIVWSRVADVAGPRDRRSPKGHVLLRKTIAFMSFQPQIACFPSIIKYNVFVLKIWKYALNESTEGLFCSRRKPANHCHPGFTLCPWNFLVKNNQSVIKTSSLFCKQYWWHCFTWSQLATGVAITLHWLDIFVQVAVFGRPAYIGIILKIV